MNRDALVRFSKFCDDRLPFIVTVHAFLFPYGKLMIRSFLAPIALSVFFLLCSGCAMMNQGPPKGSGELTTETQSPSSPTEKRENFAEFFKAKFGESSGVDPRVREIERRLGF